MRIKKKVLTDEQLAEYIAKGICRKSRSIEQANKVLAMVMSEFMQIREIKSYEIVYDLDGYDMRFTSEKVNKDE